MSARSVLVIAALAASSCRGENARVDRTEQASPPLPVRDAAAVLEPMRCARGDCAPFLVAELPAPRATALQLDGAGFAYIGTLYDDALYRIALEPGATPVVLYRSPGRDIGAIEVHGDELRWSSSTSGAIYAAPLSGSGPIRVVADDVLGVWGFASDDTTIYWADFAGSAPGTLWKKPIGGGPSVALGRDPSSHRAVNVILDAGGDLVFTDNTARVLRMPASGGAPAVWTALPDHFRASGLARDESHVYVASTTPSDAIRIDRRTRVAQTIAQSGGAYGIAADATSIYWVRYASPVTVSGVRR